jgi:hypothetical protein
VRPAYFVIVNRNGRECPAVYWDELPRGTIRNRIYVLRLDTLPNAEEILAKPVTELYAMYQRLARRGKLPPL